jgi:branched-chain amino acid transport system permease protein
MSAQIPTSSTWAARAGRWWQEATEGSSRRSRLGQVLLFVVLAAVVSSMVADGAKPDLLSVLVVASTYAMLAVGTNVLLGWSGMVTFCQATFFGCGAYTVALIRDWHWQAQYSLLLATAVCGVLGFVSFYLLSHYTHITFAMLTLVFGQFIVLVVSGSHKLGATDGLATIMREPFFGVDIFTETRFWWFAFALLAVALAAYWWLYRRTFALRLFASREDAGRLETLGYNVRRLQATAGAVSAVFAGMGGAVYALYSGAVSPTVLGFELSGAAVFMCIIGGSRYLWGPLIGAVLYTLSLNYWLASSKSETLLIGGAFVLIMLLLPSGLLSLWAIGRSLARRRSDASSATVAESPSEKVVA